MRSALIAIALGIALTSRASAQIQGEVRTGSDPVPNASVELWGSSSRVAVAAADASGRFFFTADQIATASLLVVQHIGYRTVFHRIQHLTSPVTILLEVSPPVLPDLDAPAGEVMIAFCPREKKKPRIEGQLTLRSDSTLAHARWRFLVPENDEAAGGEAVFPPITSEKQFLHPVSSMFWREHRLGSYYQRLERYGTWRVGTSEDVSAMIGEWHRIYQSKR